MGALDDAIADERRRRAQNAAHQAEATRGIPFSDTFEEAVRDFLNRVPGPRTVKVGMFKRAPRSWTLLMRNGEGRCDSWPLVVVRADGRVTGRAVQAPGLWIRGFWETRLLTRLDTVSTDDGSIERAAIEEMAKRLA